jgi:hypothetical protein
MLAVVEVEVNPWLVVDTRMAWTVVVGWRRNTVLAYPVKAEQPRGMIP